MSGLNGGKSVALGLLLALTACSSDGQHAPADDPATGAEAAPAAPLEGPTGTVSFDLRTQGDITLNKFDYAITGLNFAKAGSIDVTSSTTVSARIDGIPAGSGYAITVSGDSVGTPEALCSGSALFDVLARTVTPVPLGIQCRFARVVATAPAAQAPLPPFTGWLLALLLVGIGARTLSARRRANTLD